MAIEVIFYTPSDDFRCKFKTDDAREWLRSRGMTRSVITSRSGVSMPGKDLDELDESELAKWLAAVTLSEVRTKAGASGSFNVREKDGKWVSIRAEVVEAIGAEVRSDEPDHEDEDGEEEEEEHFDDPFVVWDPSFDEVH